MSDSNKTQLNVLAILTLTVVGGYVGVMAWSLMGGDSTIQDFSATVGPIAGTLLGYWVRDKQSPHP